MDTYKPSDLKIGLALSGSGNRTTFYIGFLEVFDEQGLKIDYISACSGGSLVAAAYACGTLNDFKKLALSLDNKTIEKYVARGENGGGLYSLDLAEQKLREFTKGKTFEEVSPRMSFVTVDLESGEQVDLCMGDIARAARISCTLPGIFEPVKWGSKTLVDGGLLSQIPLSNLKKFPVDFTIAVNMRGTKHIFTRRQLAFKRILNFFGKILFFDEVKTAIKSAKGQNSGTGDFEKNPNILQVLNRSLDLAVKAEKNEIQSDFTCDIMISPKIPLLKRNIYAQFSPYYEMGRKTAEEYMPKIKSSIEQRRVEE